MSNIEKRLNAIEQRNKRVELDKSWETSFSRKIIIAVLTYMTIVLFFIVIKYDSTIKKLENTPIEQ